MTLSESNSPSQYERKSTHMLYKIRNKLYNNINIYMFLLYRNTNLSVNMVLIFRLKGI